MAQEWIDSRWKGAWSVERNAAISVDRRTFRFPSRGAFDLFLYFEVPLKKKKEHQKNIRVVSQGGVVFPFVLPVAVVAVVVVVVVLLLMMSTVRLFLRRPPPVCVAKKTGRRARNFDDLGRRRCEPRTRPPAKPPSRSQSP